MKLRSQKLLQSLDPRDSIEGNVKAEEEKGGFVKKEEEVPCISQDSGDSIEGNVKAEEEEDMSVETKEEEVPLQIRADPENVIKVIVKAEEEEVPLQIKADPGDSIEGNVEAEEEEGGFVKKEEEVLSMRSGDPSQCDHNPVSWMTAMGKRKKGKRTRSQAPEPSKRRHCSHQQRTADPGHKPDMAAETAAKPPAIRNADKLGSPGTAQSYFDLPGTQPVAEWRRVESPSEGRLWGHRSTRVNAAWSPHGSEDMLGTKLEPRVSPPPARIEAQVTPRPTPDADPQQVQNTTEGEFPERILGPGIPDKNDARSPAPRMSLATKEASMPTEGKQEHSKRVNPYIDIRHALSLLPTKKDLERIFANLETSFRGGFGAIREQTESEARVDVVESDTTAVTACPESPQRSIPTKDASLPTESKQERSKRHTMTPGNPFSAPGPITSSNVSKFQCEGPQLSQGRHGPHISAISRHVYNPRPGPYPSTTKSAPETPSRVRSTVSPTPSSQHPSSVKHEISNGHLQLPSKNHPGISQQLPGSQTLSNPQNVMSREGSFLSTPGRTMNVIRAPSDTKINALRPLPTKLETVTKLETFRDGKGAIREQTESVARVDVLKSDTIAVTACPESPWMSIPTKDASLTTEGKQECSKRHTMTPGNQSSASGPITSSNVSKVPQLSQGRHGPHTSAISRHAYNPRPGPYPSTTKSACDTPSLVRSTVSLTPSSQQPSPGGPSLSFPHVMSREGSFLSTPAHPMNVIRASSDTQMNALRPLPTKVETVTKLETSPRGNLGAARAQTELVARVDVLESDSTALAARLDSLEASQSQMQNQILSLQLHLDDLENQDRRNNIRVRGLPEAVSPANLVHSLTGLFNSILDRDPASEIVIDRAHRALGRPPLSTALPRDVICRIHYYSAKEEILRRAWQKREVDWEGARVHILPDLSRRTLAMRRVLKPLLALIRSAGATYRWGYPFHLIVRKNKSTCTLKTPTDLQALFAFLSVDPIQVPNWLRLENEATLPQRNRM